MADGIKWFIKDLIRKKMQFQLENHGLVLCALASSSLVNLQLLRVEILNAVS